MITVTLYSRDDCHLCKVARQDLDDLQVDYPHKLEVIDVDGSKDLQRAYGFEVPVVKAGPYTLKAPISKQELQITLAAACDRQQSIDDIENAIFPGSTVWTKADSFTHWMGKHYMALFNLLVLFYLGLPFLAPVLMKVGATRPAGLIYRAYSAVCHQLGFRSFYLFGEQLVYPRQAAGVADILSFQQATGLSEASSAEALFSARTFVGDEQVGYKIALCERDVAIYGAIFLFGVVFTLTGRRIPVLPWYAWILLGLVPIGLDGLSQLLSQPPFEFWPYRESTPALRVITGGLFGWTTAWFGYPMVEETMRETRQIMASKLARVKKQNAISSA